MVEKRIRGKQLSQINRYRKHHKAFFSQISHRQTYNALKARTSWIGGSRLKAPYGNTTRYFSSKNDIQYQPTGNNGIQRWPGLPLATISSSILAIGKLPLPEFGGSFITRRTTALRPAEIMALLFTRAHTNTPQPSLLKEYFMRGMNQRGSRHP